MKVFLLGIFLAFVFAVAGNSANASMKRETCTQAKWTESCFDQNVRGRRIKPQYLHWAKFQRNGFAVLHLETGETLAINRQGQVVVSGIVSGNYDYRDAEGGIAMFSVKSRNATSEFNEFHCGYFQVSDFKIVIPAEYNRCGEFHHRQAYVCKNCRPDCIDCNKIEYYGGEGFVINTKNEILKRITLPELPLCSTVEGVGGYPADQQCRPESSRVRGD